MNYRTLLCPNCGKKIKIEEDERVFICPYCESKIDLGQSFEESNAPTREIVSGKKKRKKKNSMIALIVIFAVLFIVVITAYAFRHQIINYFTEPEGHPKDEPAPYKTETVTTAEGTDPEDDGPKEKGDKIYNFLICGQDRVSGLTDVNLLVRFNVTRLTMAVMQIPRDTNMVYDGYWYQRANGVYGYYRNGGDSENSYVQSVIDKYDKNTESELRGIAGFAAQLEQNLCIKIHY